MVQFAMIQNACASVLQALGRKRPGFACIAPPELIFAIRPEIDGVVRRYIVIPHRSKGPHCSSLCAFSEGLGVTQLPAFKRRPLQLLSPGIAPCLLNDICSAYRHCACRVHYVVLADTVPVEYRYYVALAGIVLAG